MIPTISSLAAIVAKLSLYGLGSVGIVTGAEWFNQFKFTSNKEGGLRNHEHPAVTSLREKLRR